MLWFQQSQDLWRPLFRWQWVFFSSIRACYPREIVVISVAKLSDICKESSVVSVVMTIASGACAIAQWEFEEFIRHLVLLSGKLFKIWTLLRVVQKLEPKTREKHSLLCCLLSLYKNVDDNARIVNVRIEKILSEDPNKTSSSFFLGPWQFRDISWRIDLT